MPGTIPGIIKLIPMPAGELWPANYINNMFKYELGQKAKDIITGFEGIIIGRVEYLFGCNQYGLAPQARNKEGKRAETEWFDEGRINIIGKGVLPEEVRVKEPGCEYNEHPKT